jgi:quercetin dioxygenase-like cupin family protein
LRDGTESHIPPWVFNYLDPDQGFPVSLREGVTTRIYSGRRLMLSLVTIAPNTASIDHQHPEEQWGVLLEGSCIRNQFGQEVEMTIGNMWYTPANTMHGISTGPAGAKILDIFAPPRPGYLPT